MTLVNYFLHNEDFISLTLKFVHALFALILTASLMTTYLHTQSLQETDKIKQNNDIRRIPEVFQAWTVY